MSESKPWQDFYFGWTIPRKITLKSSILLNNIAHIALVPYSLQTNAVWVAEKHLPRPPNRDECLSFGGADWGPVIWSEIMEVCWRTSRGAYFLIKEECVFLECVFPSLTGTCATLSLYAAVCCVGSFLNESEQACSICCPSLIRSLSSASWVYFLEVFLLKHWKFNYRVILWIA